MVGTPSQTAAAAAKGKTLTAEELHTQRDAALADAKEAKDEATATAAERDVVAEHAREALRRAAKARAKAARGDLDAAKDGDDDADTGSYRSGRANPDHDLLQAMLLHEAAAVVNLHHHAAGFQNIRNLVHVILDLTDDNYKRWRDQLLLVVGKYSLEDHILQETAAPAFPDWHRTNYVVKSWISDTISTDLQEAVMSRDATARTVWLALEDQFLGNQETRAFHLDAKFRHFNQGDLSITE
jgi:hypothetical protein